jgi:hypothetical protein
MTVLVRYGSGGRDVVGDALTAGRAVPAEQGPVGVPGQQGAGSGRVVEGHLSECARPLGRDRAQAEQSTDRSPRLPGLAGAADAGADFGLDRELQFAGDPDRLGRRGLRRGAQDGARNIGPVGALGFAG